MTCFFRLRFYDQRMRANLSLLDHFPTPEKYVFNDRYWPVGSVEQLMYHFKLWNIRVS